MRTYQGRRNTGKIVGYLVAMLMIFAGIALVGYSFLMGDPFASSALFGSKPPENSSLSLTVPDMQRVENVPVYTGPSNDEDALQDGTLHVNDTGFPWQDGSNVFIAGHLMGFPGTQSYRVFRDLDQLQNGDPVVLKDANGTRYTYEVFKKFVVNPDAYYVTQPVPGRSIVSLQTCTFPFYSERLIVQAELMDVA